MIGHTSLDAAVVPPRGRGRIFLVPMYEDEVVAERSAWAALLVERIRKLTGFLVSNYKMLLFCRTRAAARGLAKTIRRLHGSIAVLTAQLMGEVASAWFHAETAHFQAMSHRLMVDALKRTSGRYKLDADEAFRIADEADLAEMTVRQFGRGVWA